MRTADEANWRLEQADSAWRLALVIIWTIQIWTHHIFCKFCHLGLCQYTMRSNAWTSLKESEFLTEYIPRFLKQQGIRVIFLFLLRSQMLSSSSFHHVLKSSTRTV